MANDGLYDDYWWLITVFDNYELISAGSFMIPVMAYLTINL